MSTGSSSENDEGYAQDRTGPVVPNHLCSLGLRPQLMTGALRQVFLQHFTARENIEEPSLRDFLWRSEDVADIVIESITRWRPDVDGARPAIVIKRNSWRVDRRGIDDRCQGQHHIDGFDRYGTFMQGSHTLFCLNVNGAEAELLGAEVYRELIHSGPELRRHLGLKRFAVVEVGGVFQVKEAIGSYGVPVSIAYASEEQWIIRNHAPRLKRIVVTAMLP